MDERDAVEAPDASTNPEQLAPDAESPRVTAAILRAMVLRCGLDRDPEVLERVARDAASASDPALWTQSLREACTSVGLAATHVRVSLPRLLAAVGRGRPAVLARVTDGSLLLMSERRGQRVLVEGLDHGTPRWMSEAEVASLLEPGVPPDALVLEAEPADFLGTAPPANASHGSSARHDASAAGEHEHGPRPGTRLLAWAAGERSDLLTVLTYAVFVGLASLVTPIAVQVLVGTVTFGTMLQPLLVVAIMLAAGLAFACALRAASAWVVEVLERRFFARVTTALAARLPRTECDSHGGPPGLLHVNRFFDVFIFQKASAALLTGALEVVLTAIVGMVVLAFYHPWLLAFDVVLIAIVLVVVLAPVRRGTDTSIAESVAKHELAAHLQSIASRPRPYQAGRAPELARAMTSDGARRWIDARSAHFRVSFTQLACLLGLEAFASATLLGIGGFLVIDRQLTLGQLVAAELIVTAVVAAVAKIGKHLASYYDLAASIDKVGHLVAIPEARSGGVRIAADGALAVRVEDLSRAVLASTPGEGSTVLDVAEGSHRVVHIDDPDARERLFESLVGGTRTPEVRVAVGGVDLRDADLDHLRARIAFVLDDAVFVASVLDNVRAGDVQVSTRRALAAIERVGLRPLLDALPGRVDAAIAGPLFAHGGATRVGRVDAVRLAVARALVSDAGLVIVDGALDDLPASAREELAGALDELDATVVVLTGRAAVARAFAATREAQASAGAPRGEEAARCNA